MDNVWQHLTGNLAIVGLAISLWAHGAKSFNRFSPRYSNILFGFAFGLATVASMLMAVELRPGLFFDLRSGLLSIAGLFGGPVGAGVALVMGAGYRLALGGVGAPGGVFSMAIISTIGVAAHFATKRQGAREIHVAALAGAVAAAMTLIMMLMPTLAKANSLHLVGAPIVLSNIAVVILSGVVVLLVRRRELERRLLQAALEQAPDYLYIKDRNSRFMLANHNTATINNFASPDQLIGLTDFALTTAPRAEAHYEAEQSLMRTGEPMVDLSEQINDRIYVTSKVPLRDADGKIIGLSGVTRDVTEKALTDRELRENKALLGLAIEGMSDGFAVFDENGYLVMCNSHYQNSFPLTSTLRVPGAHSVDLVKASIAANEFKNLPDLDGHNLADKLHEVFRSNSEHELHLCDDTWLNIKIRWAEDKAIVVASDITAMKQSVEALQISAEALRSLADTDALTGLANRRAFDESLKRETARVGRNRSRLSLLMFDVDRFKAYNDTYGHQAGDSCLIAVAQCLKDATARSTDLVARYGGEEFVVLLPDTDEAGALSVAEDFVDHLKRYGILHSASEFGRVTASVGIATVNGRNGRPEAASLIRQADAALYEAKNKGRNQIQAWRHIHDVPSVIVPKAAR